MSAKSGPPQFVEEIGIVLPALEDEYHVGDLWNCRTSSFTGDNLFGVFGEPEPEPGLLLEHLVYLPKKELVYNLSHVKSTKTKTLCAKIGLHASMEINVFVGRIKINIGSADYTNEIKSETNVEELKVKYEQETFVVRLLPSSFKLIDPLVKEKLESGAADCTHVLTEVFLGAELASSILFKKVHTHEFEDKQASGLGVLLIGQISAAVKAGLSAMAGMLNNGGDEESFEINTEANFLYEVEPKSIDEMFELIQNIGKHLENGFKPFPELSEDIIGRPIRYFLVPINQFLINVQLPELQPTFRILDEYFLEDFTTILSRLKDLSQESYLRHYICQADYRLKQMLSDSGNTLYLEVIGVEDAYLGEAKALYAQCTTAYDKFIVGDVREDELKDLVGRYYDGELNSAKIDDKVQGWVQRGQRLLDALHTNDIDDDVRTTILTSKRRVEEWIKNAFGVQEEIVNYKIKVLLRTGDGSFMIDGCLLAIYELSKFMVPGSVAVTLPEKSSEISPTTDGFEFQVYVDNELWRGAGFGPNEGPAIMSLLNIISTMVGHGEPIASALFHAIIADKYGIDLYKCLEDEEGSPGADPSLSEILDTLLHACAGIQIHETFISLRQQILLEEQNSGGGENEEAGGDWQFVITLEAFDSTMDCYQCFKLLKAVADSISPTIAVAVRIQWIFGTFNLSTDNHDSPLLFIFRGGSLQAVCLDKLEIVLLANNLSSIIAPSGSNSNRSRNSPTADNLLLNLFDGQSDKALRNCFQPSRAIFTVQVSRLFNPVFVEKNSALLVAISSGARRLMTVGTSGAVRDGLLLIRAAINIAPKVELVSALTSIIIFELEHEEYSVAGTGLHFKAMVQDNGWSTLAWKFPEHSLYELTWLNKFELDLWNFIYLTGNPFLRVLGICSGTLDACVKDFESGMAEDVEFLHNARPQLDKVLEDESCDEQTKREIQGILDTSDDLIDKYKEILPLIEGLVQAELSKAETNKYTNIMFLLELLQLIRIELSPPPPELEEEEPEKEQRGQLIRSKYYRRRHIKYIRRLRVKEATEQLVLKLLHHFIVNCEEIEWPDPSLPTQVEQYIKKGLFSHVLGILTQLKFPPWHQQLFHAVAQIEIPITTANVQRVLEVVLQDADEEEEEENRERIAAFCWMNKQFQFFIHTAIDDLTFIKWLLQRYCELELVNGKHVVRTPMYFSQPVIQAINIYISSLVGEDGEEPGGGGGGGGGGEPEDKPWLTVQDVLAGFQATYLAHEHALIDTHASNLISYPFYDLFRRNMANQPALYQQLKDEVGLPQLISWNEDHSLVAEPLPVQIVRQAIDLLISYLSRLAEEELRVDDEALAQPILKQSILLRFSLSRNNESSLKLLFDDVTNIRTTIKHAKSLLTMQKRNNYPVAYKKFKKHWDANESYRELILRFALILQIESKEERNRVLHGLEAELTSWNTSLGRERRLLVEKLHEVLRSVLEAGTDGDGLAEINESEIRRLKQLLSCNYQQLNSINLQLAHFVYEFQQLYELFGNGKLGNTCPNIGVLAELNLSNFPQAMVDYFQMNDEPSLGVGAVGFGGSIQLFHDPWRNSLNPLLLGMLVDEGKIFVISVIGMKAAAAGTERVAFLQRLYEMFLPSTRRIEESGGGSASGQLPPGGSKAFPVNCAGGITVHRIPIKEGLHPFRALYLIETMECEGALVEFNREDTLKDGATVTSLRTLEEQKTISFVASISHLVVVHLPPADSDDNSRSYDRKMDELCNLVGRTVVDLGRLKATSLVPDFVFIQSNPNPDDGDGKNAETTAKLTKFITEMAFIIEANSLVFGLRHAFHEHFSQLLQRVQDGRICIELNALPEQLVEVGFVSGQEWKRVLVENWAQFSRLYEHYDILSTTAVTPASIRLQSAALAEHDLAAAHALWEMFNSLGITFHNHAVSCEAYLRAQLASAYESDEGPSFEEERKKILENIRKHLDRIPTECTGYQIDDAGGGPCYTCSVVLDTRDTPQLVQNYGIRKQLKYLADSSWNKLSQMSLVIELELFSGITPIFDHVFEKTLEALPNEDEGIIAQTVVEQLTFYYTDQVTVPLLTSQMQREVQEVYHVIPTLVRDYVDWLMGDEAMKRFDWPPNSQLAPFKVNYTLKGLIDDATRYCTQVSPTNASAGTTDLYEIGMIQHLQLQIEQTITKFQTMDPERELGLSPTDAARMTVDNELKWNIHLYALKLFYTYMVELDVEWRKGFDLIQMIRKYEAMIREEVLWRLSAAAGAAASAPTPGGRPIQLQQRRGECGPGI